GEHAEWITAELRAEVDGRREPGAPADGNGGSAGASGAGGEGAVAINEAFDTARLYHGPYRADAPDLIIGYNHGYRCSWDGATGVVAGPVFEDNVKAWSGDHCIDPRLVPGVLFASRKIDRADPALIDIAPTVLRLFGLDPLPHMDGKPLYEKAFSNE